MALFLSESDVEKLADISLALDAVEAAHRALTVFAQAVILISHPFGRMDMKAGIQPRGRVHAAARVSSERVSDACRPKVAARREEEVGDRRSEIEPRAEASLAIS